MTSENLQFIEDAQNVLKTTGLLVLDAHKSSLDIVRTAHFFRRYLPNCRIVMPMAAYMLYMPVLGKLVKNGGQRISELQFCQYLESMSHMTRVH